MRKHLYLSNKKWNKRFQKKVKKYKNFENPLIEDRIDKHSGLLVIDSIEANLLKKYAFFLCLLSFVSKTISYVFVKLTQFITGMNDDRTQETTTTATVLEVRLGNLEKTLKEYVERIDSLQQQVTEHAEKLAKLTDEQKASNNVELISNNAQLEMADAVIPSSQLPPVPNLVPVFFSSVAPPPPPPPPPPIPSMGSFKNQLVIRKPTTTAKKPQMMRPAISLEEIISVKLKKTPSAQRNQRLSKLTPSNEFPRISIEALRSVKLKKTSALLLKETSPVKSKSPKGKIRHVLRRLPITLSPGGTPKGAVRSNVISDEDDMTPVMTRALLKRFDAFQMSPESEENKENDIQFM